MNNRKEYNRQIKKIINENTPEYSIRNRELIIEKVYKYAILALARVISQQVQEPDTTVYEKNRDHIIEIMICGIDVHHTFEVENALEIIENNVEHWSWDIAIGMRRIDPGDIMEDSNIDVECLIAAVAILINREFVSDDYCLKQEYSQIRDALLRGNLEKVLPFLSVETRVIIEELYEKNRQSTWEEIPDNIRSKTY